MAGLPLTLERLTEEKLPVWWGNIVSQTTVLQFSRLEFEVVDFFLWVGFQTVSQKSKESRES